MCRRRERAGGVHCRHVHGRPVVDRRRARINHLQLRVAAGRRLAHDISSIWAGGP